jgi:very-short-patch-repair endonuclease
MVCKPNQMKLCGVKECVMCFNRSFAIHEKSQYWNDKNVLKPWDVRLNSNKKYYFDCLDCDHEILTSPSRINNNKWCKYCRPNPFLCDDIECKVCYYKSFASHPKSEIWNHNLNIGIPRDYTLNSMYMATFNCTCGHRFQSPISNVIHCANCIYCCEPSQNLCTDMNCKSCFNKSFASHYRSKNWSPKNILKPRDIFLNDSDKYLFDCECEHEILKSPASINLNKWCGYCCYSPSLLCRTLECKICLENSFYYSPLARFWSDKNELKPYQIFRNDSRRFIFNCEYCKREYLGLPSLMTSKNSSCPFCIHKTEAKLYDWLITLYKIIREVKFEWCKNLKTNACFKYDFLLEDLNIIIELDGSGHFIQIKNWNHPDLSRARDVYKMKLALDRNYHIIRILQEDIWFDRINWKNILTNLINQIKDSGVPQVLYATDSNLYDKHKEDFQNIELLQYLNSANMGDEKLDDSDELITNLENLNLIGNSKPRLNIIPTPATPIINLISVPTTPTLNSISTPIINLIPLTKPKPKLKLLQS